MFLAIKDDVQVFDKESFEGNAVRPVKTPFKNCFARINIVEDGVCVVFSAGRKHNNLVKLSQLLESID